MADLCAAHQLAPLLPLPQQLAEAQQQAAQVCTALLSCATGGTPVRAVVYGCILTSGVGAGMLSSWQSWVLRTQLAPAQQQVANLEAQVAGLEAQVCTALTLCAPVHLFVLAVVFAPSCQEHNAGTLGWWQTCVLRMQLAPLLPLPQQLAEAQQQAAQVCTALLSCANGGTPVRAVVYGCALTSEKVP